MEEKHDEVMEKGFKTYQFLPTPFDAPDFWTREPVRAVYGSERIAKMSEGLPELPKFFKNLLQDKEDGGKSEEKNKEEDCRHDKRKCSYKVHCRFLMEQLEEVKTENDILKIENKELEKEIEELQFFIQKERKIASEDKEERPLFEN